MRSWVKRWNNGDIRFSELAEMAENQGHPKVAKYLLEVSEYDFREISPFAYKKACKMALRHIRDTVKVECQGCGIITTFEDWHKEHKGGGITHTHLCGYDLITGKLGPCYGSIKDGSCKECQE